MFIIVLGFWCIVLALFGNKASADALIIFNALMMLSFVLCFILGELYTLSKIFRNRKRD